MKRLRVIAPETVKGDDVRPPLAASFVSGPPPAQQLDRGIAGRGQFEVRYRAKRGNAKEKFLDISTGTREYSGSSQHSGLGKQHTKHFMGLFNKEKGTVKLVPLEVVPVRQSLDEEDTFVKETVGDTNAERKQSLIKEFGSLKRQRAERSKAANRVKAENVEGGEEALSSIKEERKKPESEEKEDQHMKTRRAVLPPFHLEATKPEEAYPLHELIAPSDARALTDMVTEVSQACKNEDKMQALKANGTTSGFYLPEYVFRLIALLGPQQEGKKLKITMRACVYLAILLKFFRSPMVVRYVPPKSAQTQAEGEEPPALDASELVLDVTQGQLSGVPMLVVERLLSLFAEEQDDPATGLKKYRRNARTNDRLLMYIMVTALHAVGFRLKVNPLAKTLRMAPNKIAHYLRVVGCKVSSTTAEKKSRKPGEEATKETVYSATLPAPLQFPDNKRRRGTAR